MPSWDDLTAVVCRLEASSSSVAALARSLVDALCLAGPPATSAGSPACEPHRLAFNAFRAASSAMTSVDDVADCYACVVACAMSMPAMAAPLRRPLIKVLTAFRRDWPDVCHTVDDDAVATALAGLVAQPEDVEVEWKMVLLSGDPQWLDAVATRLGVDAGLTRVLVLAVRRLRKLTAWTTAGDTGGDAVQSAEVTATTAATTASYQLAVAVLRLAGPDQRAALMAAYAADPAAASPSPLTLALHGLQSVSLALLRNSLSVAPVWLSASQAVVRLRMLSPPPLLPVVLSAFWPSDTTTTTTTTSALSTMVPLGQLSVVQTLLALLPPACLHSPESPSSPSLHAGRLLQAVLSLCESTSVLVRRQALIALKTWLKVAASVPPAVLDQLLTVLLTNWEHTNRSVASSVPNVFNQLLVVQSAVTSDPATLLASRLELMDTLLCRTRPSVATFAAAHALLDHVGALELLEARPDVVRLTMAATGGPGFLTTPATSFLQRLLQLCLEQMTNAVSGDDVGGAGAGAGASAAANDDAASATPPQAKKNQKKKRDRRMKRHGAKQAAITDRVKLLQHAVDMDALLAAAGPSDDDPDNAEYAVRWRWRKHWLAPLATQLVSPDPAHRRAAFNNVFPHLLALDPTCPPSLMQAVAVAGSPSPSPTDATLADRRLLARLAIVRIANLREVQYHLLFGHPGAPVPAHAPLDALDPFPDRWAAVSPPPLPPSLATTVSFPPSAQLSADDFHACVVHSNPDIRREALDVCTFTTTAAAFPSYGELAIVRQYVLAGTKTASATSKAQSFNVTLLSRFLQRLHAATHTPTRQLQYMYGLLESGAVPDDATIRCPADVEATPEFQQVSTCSAFVSWFVSVLTSMLYPGAPHNRADDALRLLESALTLWPPAAPPAVPQLPPHVSHPTVGALTPAAVASVQNTLLFCSMDGTRRAALDALKLMPAPLPGLEAPDVVARQVAWAMSHCHATTVRDCDAAALLLRLVFHRYVITAGWRFELSGVDDGEDVSVVLAADAPDGATASPTAHFFHQLLAVIRRRRVRLQATVHAIITPLTPGVDADMAAVPDNPNDLPLVHGLFQALQGLLSEVDLPACAADPVTRPVWQSLVNDLMTESQLCYETALLIVATEGDGAEGGDGDGDGDGDDPSSSSSSTRLIDCRGHLMAASHPAFSPQLAQVVVHINKSSWMLIKETTGCIKSLVHTSPLPVLSDATVPWLLSADAMTHAIHSLVDALLALKHPGAVTHCAAAFEAAAVRALGHGKRYPALAQLPGQVLDALLDRTHNADSQFILRRSAGFGAVFLALLAAGRATNQPSLVSRATRRLLYYVWNGAPPSSDTALVDAPPDAAGGVGWRSCLHAMNILRLVIQSVLTSDERYLSSALRAAVAGFESPRFHIRNSSMMLFTSVVTRLVGAKVTADDTAVDNMVSAHQLFDRFPELPAYLHDTMHHATRGDADDVHPSLFPLLYLLSRMSMAQPSSSGKAATLAISDVLIRCGTTRHHMVREMTARALAASTEPKHVWTVLTAVLTRLVPVSPPSTASAVPANHLHGALCQLLFVLRAHMARAGPPSPSFLAALAARSWWATGLLVLPCAKVQDVALQVLVLLSTAVGTAMALPDWRVVALQALDTVPASGTAGQCLFLQTAAVVAVKALVPDLPSVASARDAMEDVLQHDVEEVRWAAMKQLKRSLEGGGVVDAALGVSWLVPVLMARVTAERHPAAHRNALKALFLVGHPAAVSASPVFWDVLVAQEAACRTDRTRCALLSVMGSVLGHVLSTSASSSSSSSSSVVTAALQQWTAIVERVMQHVAAYDVREVAMQATLAAGALGAEASPGRVHPAVVPLWTVCVATVQDDDSDVRTAAKAVLAATLPGTGTTEDVALPQCLAWLSARAGDSPAYKQFLVAVLASACRDAAPHLVSRTSADATTVGDDALGKALLYSEPLQLGELAAQQVAALADAELAQAVLAAVTPVVLASLEVLVAQGGAAGGGMFGMPVMSNDVFSGVVAAWAGFAAAAGVVKAAVPAEHLDVVRRQCAALAPTAASRLHPRCYRALDQLMTNTQV